MSKPNSSFQQANRETPFSRALPAQTISKTKQLDLPQAAQKVQQESTALAVKLDSSSSTVSSIRPQPPLNFELARHATLTAEFLRGLHLGGKLLPLLREATIERSLLQHANASELIVTPLELQAAADTFRQQNGLSTAADMGTWLSREHLNIADFEDALQRDLLVSKLRDHVTRGRIASHFDIDPSRYDRAHLRQIVVKRESLASTLHTQLSKKSSDFSETARNYSLEQTLEDQDDDLKLVFRSHLPQSSSESIFSAKPTDVIGPIQIGSNFHLFQVEKIEPAELDDFTVESIRSELFDNWLSEQFHNVQIDAQLLKLLP